MEPEEGDRAVIACETCGEQRVCVYGPDPYDYELGAGLDAESIWQCDECAHESAMAV